VDLARESEIESGIIDEHDRVGLQLADFAQRFAKLFSEISVFFHDLPQPDDGRVVDPIIETFPGNRFHLRPAAADERKIDI
jgi:hypothetical protein